MSKNKPPPSPLCVLRGHEGFITVLHFTNEMDGTITEKPSLISGSQSGEIIIWSLKTCRPYHKFQAHNGKLIQYLCYFKSSLISQGRDGYIHEWSYTENEWNITRSFESSNFGFCAAFLFPVEAQIYLVTPVGEKSSIAFYDYERSTRLKTYELEESKSKNTLGMCMCMKVFAKDTKLYTLVGCDSGFVSLWDYESNEEKSRLKCHPNSIFCLDYDSNFKNCGISGSVDDILKIWSIDEKDQLVKSCDIKITNPGINAVRIRSDGKIVITAGQDKSIRVFSWKSLKPLAVLKWHNAPVSCLTFSDEPFGKYSSIFASGSKDKNIYVSSIY